MPRLIDHLVICVHDLAQAALDWQRLGFALTLLGTLIGEMFASQRGLGYMLVKAMETNDVGTVMALALLLITLATMASSVLLAVDRKLHRGAAPA